MSFDLGVEGGTLVSAGGRRRANLYVRDGKIAAVTTHTEASRERIDAGGLLVMPGMVDTHVHLMDPSDTEREDFPSGTAAAAIAGVTSIIEHSHGGPVRDRSQLDAKRAYLGGRSHVDFGLAAHAWPDRLDEVADVWAAGAAFFKVFTCTTHGIPGFDAGALRDLFTLTAGVDAICLVHNEDGRIVDRAEAALRAAGRDDPGLIIEWRSREAELAALSVTSLLARSAGARVVMAHVSTPEAIELVDAERRRGCDILIETCPQYLTLREGEVLDEGAFRKFTPPARARSGEDLGRMWQAVAIGGVDHISTDHAPSTRAQKQAGSIWDVHFGLPGLDTTLPILLDAASAGRISHERVVEIYAEAPARTYRLPGGKGRLVIGSDADIALVDPARRWRVTAGDLRSKAAWSPFEGRVLTGAAVMTILRGRVIARERQIIGDVGHGRFLAGPGARAA